MKLTQNFIFRDGNIYEIESNKDRKLLDELNKLEEKLRISRVKGESLRRRSTFDGEINIDCYPHNEWRYYFSDSDLFRLRELRYKLFGSEGVD